MKRHITHDKADFSFVIFYNLFDDRTKRRTRFTFGVEKFDYCNGRIRRAESRAVRAHQSFGVNRIICRISARIAVGDSHTLLRTVIVICADNRRDDDDNNYCT